MSIDNITRNNTVDEWRIQTNQSANALNHIETIDYDKSNGIFKFSGPTTTLLITALGTPLQVVNTAQFSTNVTIGLNMSLGDVSTKKGNLSVGNTVSIYGSDNALYVANNVNVGSNVFVFNSMNTNNLIVRNDGTINRNLVIIANTTAGNLTTANATQTGNLRVTYDATIGTTLTVTGNTTGGNLITANATQTGNLRVISDATVGTTLVVTGNTTGGNLITANATQTGNLRVTSDANVGTTLVVTGNTTAGNLTTANATQTGSLRVTTEATVGTTLTITGNTTGGNLITANATQTGNLRVTSDANVGTTLVVTGNTTSGNLTTANATQTGSLRVTSDANVGTTLVVTGNTTSGNLTTANATSTGTLIVTGNTISGNLTTANATQTGNLRVISDATVGTTLVVTGNTTAGNLITANATSTGTLIVTGNTTSGNLTTANASQTRILRVDTDATVGANLTVTVNVAVGNLSTSNSITAGFISAATSNLGSASAQSLTVAGNFTLLGNTIFDSDRITLRANTPTNIGIDNSFIEIRRQKGIDIGTSANANAQIRWNEGSKYWDIRSSDTPDFYEKILTSNSITDSTTTTSSSMIASATAIKTTNDNITANVLNSGAAVVVAQTFDSTITDLDPGNGKFRFNNATIGSATFAYMDNLDAYGATITGILSAYGDSTNAVKGHLRFSVFGASTTKFAVFAITSPAGSTAASGYYKVGLTYVSGAGTFTNGDLVMVQYSRAGNVGAQGAVGAQGVQGVAGAQGVQGPQGVQGFNGTQGANGAPGAQGVQGVVGAQGVQGVVGAQGVQGVVGAQGVQGVVGAQGVQGVVGAQGAQGVQGVAGTSSYTFQSLVNASQQNGGVIYRTSAVDGDSQYATTQAYHNAYLSFRPGQTNQVVYGGLDDTAQDTGAGNIQYGWYFNNDGLAYIIYQGSLAAGAYSYTTSSIATFYFDGTSLIWVLNGTVRLTSYGPAILHSLSNPLYAVGRLTGPIGTTITNFVFGPMGKSGTVGAQGAGGSPGAQGATGGFSTNSNGQVNSLGVGTAASGSQGEIRATGAITAGYSDDRLKTRLGNIENARIKIAAISGFYYEPNQTAQDLGYKLKREVGVSAQEVQSVLPEIVVSAPVDDQYLTVHYEKLVPLLIEAVKDLYEKVEVIETKIKDK